MGVRKDEAIWNAEIKYQSMHVDEAGEIGGSHARHYKTS